MLTGCVKCGGAIRSTATGYVCAKCGQRYNIGGQAIVNTYWSNNTKPAPPNDSVDVNKMDCAAAAMEKGEGE